MSRSQVRTSSITSSTPASPSTLGLSFVQREEMLTQDDADMPYAYNEDVQLTGNDDDDWLDVPSALLPLSSRHLLYYFDQVFSHWSQRRLN